MSLASVTNGSVSLPPWFESTGGPSGPRHAIVSVLAAGNPGNQGSAAYIAPYTLADLLGPDASDHNPSLSGSTLNTGSDWSPAGSITTNGAGSASQSTGWTGVADLMDDLGRGTLPVIAGTNASGTNASTSDVAPTLLVVPLYSFVLNTGDLTANTSTANLATGGGTVMTQVASRTALPDSGDASAGYPLTIPAGFAGNLSFPGPGDQQFSGAVSDSDRVDTITIPLSALGPNMMLMLRSVGAKPEDGMPVFGNISLADSQGRPIMGAGLPWMPQADSHIQDAMIDVQQAPVGSELLVQVAAFEGTSASLSTTNTATSTTASPAAGWTMPFVMDVMRQTAQASTALSAFLTTGTLAISALSPTSGNPFGLSSTTNETGSAADESVPEAGTNFLTTGTVLTTGAASNVNEPDVEGGGDVRVPTGPLVSRNSSPLGPTLASLVSDPVPAADRHERATLNELGLDFEPNATDQPRNAGRPGDFDALATLAQNAGMNTDRSDDDRVHLQLYALDGQAAPENAGLNALAAAMADRRFGNGQQTNSRFAESLTGQETISTDAVMAARETGVSERPSNLSGACGLVILVGLSSGPILPVLFPQIRSMGPRLFARRYGRQRPSGLG